MLKPKGFVSLHVLITVQYEQKSVKAKSRNLEIETKTEDMETWHSLIFFTNIDSVMFITLLISICPGLALVTVFYFFPQRSIKKMPPETCLQVFLMTPCSQMTLTTSNLTNQDNSHSIMRML